MAATIISRLPANFATAPFDYSYEVLGRTLGRSKSEISRALLLLKLPRAVCDDYHLHKPTKKQLWAIAEIEDIDAQTRTWGGGKSAIGSPALLSPSAPEKYDNGNGLDPAPRVETRWENPDVALSTLPKRLARRIQQAHQNAERSSL